MLGGTTARERVHSHPKIDHVLREHISFTGIERRQRRGPPQARTRMCQPANEKRQLDSHECKTDEVVVGQPSNGT
eukprot:1171458-Amphidinium_carterae.1